ncbi:MAG: insulinase family protein, partial [Candidatus Bathyarchaeia archaeon]
ESSRLYRKIKIEKELMHGIWAQSYTPKEPGIIGIGGTLEPNKLLPAIEATCAEVFKTTFEKVTPTELEKAKNQLLSGLTFESATVQGQARKLGYYIDVANDPDFERKYIEKIDRLTPDDIKNVAKKYLRKDSASIVVLMPETSTPPTEEHIRQAFLNGYINARAEKNQRSSTFNKSIFNAQKVSVKPSIKGYEILEEKEGITKALLKNGITVLFKPNRSVPTFSIRILALGGLRSEEEKNQGISNFVAEMLTRGTKNRSYQEIADEVDFLGGVIAGTSGRNTTGVTADFLSRHFERAVELVADITKNPSFPPEEIERKRRELIFAIERKKDDPMRSAIDLFCQTLYKQHPYRFTTLGSKESIQNITRDDLIAHYDKLFNPKNIVISIVGDLNKEYALSTVAQFFGDWEKLGAEFINPKTDSKPKELRIAQETIEKEQCHIVVGFLGNTIYSKDRYAMDVLNAILSAQGGRLFTNLRDKKHLAYALTSVNNPGIEPGVWLIYLGTRPENISQALGDIKQELEALIKDNISPEELERAKKYLIGSHAIELQTSSAQA